MNRSDAAFVTIAVDDAHSVRGLLLSPQSTQAAGHMLIVRGDRVGGSCAGAGEASGDSLPPSPRQNRSRARYPFFWPLISLK